MRVHLKSPDEIRAMRAAGKATGEILEQLRQAARPGVTPLELDGLAAELISRTGAVSSFLGYGAHWGVTPFPANTCISVNDTVVHGIPDGRPLRDGDLVSIDFGVAISGWHGDSAVTFTIGEVSATARKLCDITREALWQGISQARVGRRLGDIGAAVQNCVRAADRGFGLIRDFTGHGIGRAMHEDPDVPNYGKPGRGLRIEDGLVIAIEPMVTAGSARTLEMDDGWTVKTADHSPAAHWEHTVAITKQGVWVLTAPDGGEAELSARGIPYAPLA